MPPYHPRMSSTPTTGPAAPRAAPDPLSSPSRTASTSAPVSGAWQRSGDLGWYVAGSGPALLLVHSVNAAASVAEVRPMFEHSTASRTVFAVDLPGFGSSLRSDRAYTPRLMTDALHQMRAEVARRCGPAPVDALAVSLGCEFLARAATEQPQHWGRLALVSPTGLDGSKPRQGPPGSTRAVPGLHTVLAAPLWGERLFRQLTRPGVVRYFLERTWGGRQIDETLWAQAVAQAAQPGAHHAPLHFLGGGLFSADIHNVYDRLSQPVWVSHGIRGDFTDYRGKTRLQGRSNWQFSVCDSGAMPYFEHPGAFNQALDAFLAGQPVPARLP